MVQINRKCFYTVIRRTFSNTRSNISQAQYERVLLGTKLHREEMLFTRTKAGRAKAGASPDKKGKRQ